jgi:hypothetical protein
LPESSANPCALDGPAVAPGSTVVRRATPGKPYSLDDGLGVRQIETDGRTNIEVLELAPALAAKPGVEQAIRDRAARHAGLDVRLFAPVTRIERVGTSLRIVSELPGGVRLSHLLAHLECTGEVVPDTAMRELAALVINTVASLHASSERLAHGAINPAHLLVTNDGRVVMTDCVYGAGLEALQRNREQLWKEFGVALPTAAGVARFDQQTDVTQMGALVLAIALQRPLRTSEYPRGISDLVVNATEPAPGAAGSPTALRMWLQEALQIHPRLVFRSAVEAQRSFTDIDAGTGSRRAGPVALQVLLRTTCREPLKQAPVVVKASPPVVQDLPHGHQGSGEVRRPFESAVGTDHPRQAPN